MLKMIDMFLLKWAERFADFCFDRFKIFYLRLAQGFMVTSLVAEVIFALTIMAMDPSIGVFMMLIVFMAGSTTLKMLRFCDEIKTLVNDEVLLEKNRNKISRERTTATVFFIVGISVNVYFWKTIPGMFLNPVVLLAGGMMMSNVLFSGISYYIISCKPPIAEE